MDDNDIEKVRFAIRKTFGRGRFELPDSAFTVTTEPAIAEEYAYDNPDDTNPRYLGRREFTATIITCDSDALPDDWATTFFTSRYAHALTGIAVGVGGPRCVGLQPYPSNVRIHDSAT